MISIPRTTISFLTLAILLGLANSQSHPLDPLSTHEIYETAQIIEAYNPSIEEDSAWMFNWITLKEPPKILLLSYFLSNGEDAPLPLEEIPRKSFTVLVERTRNIVIEVVVNLHTKEVESWETLPEGTQATYHGEWYNAETIAKADHLVKDRCRQMGWLDMDLVRAEAWSPGHINDGPVLAYAKRPMLVYFYGRMFKGDNHYAHPFDFMAVVDVAAKMVKAIHNLPTHDHYDADDRRGNTCPRKSVNYHPKFKPPNFEWRDVNPVFASQPEGAGYKLWGNELTWLNFKMRLGFNGREGLVIHHVSFRDGKVERPLFYRMSVAEMFVPYGDPRKPFHQKIPFDIGQFTLGFTALNLRYNQICKGGGEVAYIDGFLSWVNGYGYRTRNVVCIYEEDTGLIWAHQTPEGRVIHKRNQRLTVTFMSNLGNYDYKFSWHFYQDGSIEFKSQMDGILSTNLVAQNVSSGGGFGTIVQPSVNAQYHQHYFALRLDTEIDGNLNRVLTNDIVPLEQPSGSPQNPYGIGFTVRNTVLKTPLDARTKISPNTGRTWVIENPEKIHPTTSLPVGWKLIPHLSPLPFMRSDSPMFPKCSWAEHNLWVTKYKDDQLYPGGFYLGNGDGLAEWVKQDPAANLTMTDVVLWYIYGSTHIPRIEDFPVMPAETIGFALKPTNFFQQNPSIDNDA